jgi:hypothetical protein
MKITERPLTHDPELLELLPDRADLFAVADAVAATQPVPNRRPKIAAALVAAALAAALAFALVGPDGPGDSAVVGRALAAVGQGKVLHVVARIEPGGRAIDLATGRVVHPYQVVEEWYEPGVGLRARIAKSNAYLPKRLPSVADVAPGYVEALNGFTSRYAEALRSNRAEVDRHGTLFGKRVIWLRFRGGALTPVTGQPTYEVAIDTSTYRPLYIQQLGESGKPNRATAMRLLSVQLIAAVPRSAPPAPPPASARTMAGIDNLGPLPLMEAASFMTRPGLWLGSEFAGLPLVRIEGQRYSYGQADRFSDIKRHWHGLRLVYGTDRLAYGTYEKGEPWLELTEQTDPIHGPGNPPLDGTLVMYDDFAGEAQVNGVYVEISARSASGVDPELIISAARALRPIPAGG